ncbi:MAG: DNA cytosine methyltransferase [Egibacteraceae bacterium]
MSGDARTAVDLFCGAGGISLGLERAGYRVLAAVDVDRACAQTHRRNLPEQRVLLRDIRDLSASALAAAADLAPRELDLLIGGPPCQGYSIIGRRLVHDERNDLFREFLRLGAELRPKCMVIENVPGLATLGNGVYIEAILDGYRCMGYSVAVAELLAAQYGAPQMRWRMVFIGFRSDLAIPPGAGFPQPTHGIRKIGELIPHCTIPKEDLHGFVTAREAIGDLPAIPAGGSCGSYQGPPTSGYQRQMRAGLTNELHNHYAARLSAQNIARLAALRPGQDWRDLPTELLPGSMRRAKRKDHTRRYRRMTWEGVPRAIITRFRDPKTGEYTHPEQDRTLSIREAARIQGFPDSFVFSGTVTEQYEQVGNAVPVQLGEAVGRSVAATLDGTSTFRLHNAFSRRPAMRQARLALHPQ